MLYESKRFHFFCNSLCRKLWNKRLEETYSRTSTVRDATAFFYEPGTDGYTTDTKKREGMRSCGRQIKPPLTIGTLILFLLCFLLKLQTDYEPVCFAASFFACWMEMSEGRTTFGGTGGASAGAFLYCVIGTHWMRIIFLSHDPK